MARMLSVPPSMPSRCAMEFPRPSRYGGTKAQGGRKAKVASVEELRVRCKVAPGPGEGAPACAIEAEIEIRRRDRRRHVDGHGGIDQHRGAEAGAERVHAGPHLASGAQYGERGHIGLVGSKRSFE